MSLAEADTAAALVEPATAIRGVLNTLRDGFSRDPDPDLATRRDRLDRLAAVLLDNRDELADAISADFGHRSKHESLMAEVFVPVTAIRHARKHLRSWMRTRQRPTALTFLPASNYLRVQPLGVIGIVSPWNYPLQLSMIPLATALAAGNRAALKPSELTPRTSELLASKLSSAFPADLVATVIGGADIGAAFTELPFDHLVFTGSTAVGRHVMKSASRNLVPVTLELGGKSPVIVHRGADLDRAADRIAQGKLFNAGQTCVAPDYVLVHESERDPLAARIEASIARLYPTLADNPDYTSIINDRHRARLASLLEDARAKGARVVEVNPRAEDFSRGRKMAPHLIFDVNAEMTVAHEEIFGPLLPIIGVPDLDAAISFVNERPRPLALYYFDHDQARIERVLSRTHSGGVCVNETLMHAVQEDLPFGGVGASGMGAYHGIEGFDALSHRKPVFHQARLNGVSLFNPPYGRRIERLLDLLIGR
jgi:coniferyl-aldehyde dehydrogenase